MRRPLVHRLSTSRPRRSREPGPYVQVMLQPDRPADDPPTDRPFRGATAASRPASTFSARRRVRVRRVVLVRDGGRGGRRGGAEAEVPEEVAIGSWPRRDPISVPINPRGAAAATHGISARHPRRRRDPRNIRVAPAAAPRPISAEYSRSTRTGTIRRHRRDASANRPAGVPRPPPRRCRDPPA